jgi:hypothetical protein
MNYSHRTHDESFTLYRYFASIGIWYYSFSIWTHLVLLVNLSLRNFKTTIDDFDAHFQKIVMKHLGLDSELVDDSFTHWYWYTQNKPEPLHFYA